MSRFLVSLEILQKLIEKLLQIGQISCWRSQKIKDMFNPDETGLYFRTLPKQSMVVKGDPRKGIKTAKERMTVCLACSATGEKLKPLVISRAENPRCLKGVNKSSLPVTYKFNRRAWITASIFYDWLDHLNSKMKLQGRHILLFLDNCAAHPHVQLSNVKLQFFPKHHFQTTALWCWCDLSIKVPPQKASAAEYYEISKWLFLTPTA